MDRFTISQMFVESVPRAERSEKKTVEWHFPGKFPASVLLFFASSCVELSEAQKNSFRDEDWGSFKPRHRKLVEIPVTEILSCYSILECSTSQDLAPNWICRAACFILDRFVRMPLSTDYAVFDKSWNGSAKNWTRGHWCKARMPSIGLCGPP